MKGDPFRHFCRMGMLGPLLLVAVLLSGCGFTTAGFGETVSVPVLPTEDLEGPCRFDINMPDQPLTSLPQQPGSRGPAVLEAAVLVIYERGDSAALFNDPQIQSMAANLHLVTVFARQCNSKSHGDIQAEATKGQGRVLFAALNQYATDSGHPEIASLKLVLSGFSAAGVLSTTMANAYPDRILGFLPYASGSVWVDLDTIPVSPAAARIPALVLANAYDPASGVERSLRYFQRGWQQGAPWGFGVQNNTGHCCTLSNRDVMIPWITALVKPLEVSRMTSASARPSAAVPSRVSAGYLPTVRFLCYTDGYRDAYGETDCWMPSASILPETDGGPQAGWLPDAASARAWVKWVTNPGTN